MTITFTSVTAPGITTLSSSSTGPPLPAGFEVTSSYYTIETSVSFTDAEVCFPYIGPAPSFIAHWIGGTLTREPITRDTGSDVCAQVNSFSPFALARAVAGSDVEPPQISCGAADGTWHAGNVSISCTAKDSGSGLANPADSDFTLSTSVPPGTENADASTGSHQVCDAAANCATAGPITGNKIDRKAPTLSLPANQSVDATGPGGATVTFTASAIDGADPNPTVTCNPAAGSTLTIGTHTVDCKATDQVGNAADGSFSVTVLGAKQQLNRLIGDVVATSTLSTATKTRLVAALQSLVAQFDPSNPTQRKLVCSALATFATALRLMAGHEITQDQATQWTADANRIRAVIGC